MNKDVKIHVEQILNSSIRAAQHMEGMLSFPGRGRLPPPTRPNKLIVEAIEAARAQCPANVILSSDLEEGLPWIRIAPQDLVNAILNLILNGIESIEDKSGTLSVTAKHLEESIIPATAFGAMLDGHPSLLLIVKDNGSGMDEQTKSHIYEPFFSTKDSGKGLGLMSVFSIVQHYGGAIFCESTVGVGTIFKLWIPLSAAPKIHQEKPTSDFVNRNIILVEDNYDVRVVELLKTMDINVQEFSSAEEVLAMLNKNMLEQTDLYLLDIRLNGISGVQLAHKIRSEDFSARILFMSGDEHEHTMDQFKGQAHTGFMRKPINLDILNSALRILGSRKQ
jgi:CheY-like chemotaxis protein